MLAQCVPGILLPLDGEVLSNAEGECLDRVAMPGQNGKALLTAAVDRMKLSARGYHRVQRFACNLADLEGSAEVGRAYIADTLSHRRIHPQT